MGASRRPADAVSTAPATDTQTGPRRRPLTVLSRTSATRHGASLLRNDGGLVRCAAQTGRRGEGQMAALSALFSQLHRRRATPGCRATRNAAPSALHRSTRRRPRTLFDPSRAAREALAMIVLPDDLAAVAVEDDERRGMPLAAAARLAERVRREIGGLDGRGRHRARLPRDERARPVAPDLHTRIPPAPAACGEPWQ